MILILEYFYWQFIETPQRIVRVFGNLIWFGFNYFSVLYCLKTLFSPWKRINWSCERGFNLGNKIETCFSNGLARLIGFIMRVFILSFWLVYNIIISLIFIITLLLWILFPIIAILGIVFSFNLL